ncbi:hypothetical protein ACQEVM_18190 [Streptomyces sp. CA-243310]
MPSSSASVWDCSTSPAPDRSWQRSALRGKAVLIDFWTYSCINCRRSLPHIQAWDRAYRDEGLTFVDVHSPAFALPSPARTLTGW